VRCTGRTTAALQTALFSARQGNLVIFVVHAQHFAKYCLKILQNLAETEEIQSVRPYELRLVGGGAVRIVNIT